MGAVATPDPPKRRLSHFLYVPAHTEGEKFKAVVCLAGLNHYRLKPLGSLSTESRRCG